MKQQLLNKPIRSIIWLFIISFISYTTTAQQTPNLIVKLDSVFKYHIQKNQVKNGSVHIYRVSKPLNIVLNNHKPATINSPYIHAPFYTASITKTLTASAIGILKDQKKIQFNDAIYTYLPEEMMLNLHVLNGVDSSKNITIAHLLQHTSGLPDYFTDTTNNGRLNVLHQIVTYPNKTWKPHTLIQFTKDNMTPHFLPGQGYHYTDTAYVLLGLIIENVSGLKLATFFKEHIFKPLKMNGSSINLKSAPLKKQLPVTEFYVGNQALSTFKSLSADWAGGGLISTSQDLINFMLALQQHAIVSKETYLEMQQWIPETIGMAYGFGIRKVSLHTLWNTTSHLQLIGHTGSTAAFLWYCPQLDTYIAGSFNQVEHSKKTLQLVYDLLQILDKTQ